MPGTLSSLLSSKSLKSLLIIALLCALPACGAKNKSDLGYFSSLENRLGSEFLSVSPFDQDSLGEQKQQQVAQKSGKPYEVASIGGKDIYQKLWQVAKTQIGNTYRSGGTDPATGFDCSGFTTWVYRNIGVNLPRSSREQFMIGKAVAKNELKKGDLVFFARKKRISHVGIYLENGDFIHSTNHRDTVKISNLSEPVYEKEYVGGRRVL